MFKYLSTSLLAVLISSLSPASFAVYEANWKRWTSGSGVDVVDYSGWHHCPRNQRGGSCGSRALRTGSSRCSGHGYSFGVDFEFPGQLVSWMGGKGFKLKGGRSYNWTTCNTRSESVTCSPNKGYRGRAEIFRVKRRADVAFTEFNQSFGYGQSHWGPTRVKNLWWPTGDRYSRCTYRRL